MQFFLFSSLLGTVLANPLQKRAAPNCSQLSQNCAPTVYTFCSSYNHVTATTTTSTVSQGTATTTSTFVGGTTTTTITASTCAATTNKLKAIRDTAAQGTKPPQCLKATATAPLSSACSCLATTNTVTSTTTVASTTTTLTTTVQRTATFTSLNPPPCATVTQQGTSYHDTFAGCGVEENGSNPGGNQVFISHYPGSIGACAAISSCANAAASKTTTLGVVQTYAAGSFDIHLLTSDQWECVAYQKISNDPGYFNVQNSNVLAAYGYAV